MRAIWQGRVSQAVASYGEHAPMATACCNTCRTCAQTNAISLALTIVAAGAGLAGLGRRHLVRSSKAESLRNNQSSPPAE